MFDLPYEGKIITEYKITNLQILYFLPDYDSLVQEFFWQTLDVDPEYPRISRFLDFWKDNIDAAIKEINICQIDSGMQTQWHNVDHLRYLN